MDAFVKYGIKTLVFFMLMVFSANAYAQCAMCRASVENNVSNGESTGIASGLNTGILYLFVMPYLLAMILGYFWFKKSRQQKKLKQDAALRRHRIQNLT